MAISNKVTFDKLLTGYLFEVNSATDYAGLGLADSESVNGLMKLSLNVGSGYVVLSDNTTVATPNYVVARAVTTTGATTNPLQIPIPTDSSGKVLIGTYKFEFTEYGATTNPTVSILTSTTEIIYQVEVDSVICLSTSVSVVAPSIQLSDSTNYAFNSIIPTVTLSTTTLNYPTTASQVDLITTSYPLALLTDNVWTGAYNAVGVLNLTYDFTAYLEKLYLSAELGFGIDNTSLCSLLPCITSLKSAMDGYKGKNTVKYDTLYASWIEAMAIAEQIDINVSCSEYDNVPSLIEDLKSVINDSDCSVNCSSCASGSSTMSQKVYGLGTSSSGTSVTVTNGIVNVSPTSKITVGNGLILTEPSTGDAHINAEVTAADLAALSASLPPSNNYSKTYVSGGSSNEEFATFDLLEWSQGNIDGYTHIGQSSCASYNKTNGIIMSVFRAGASHVSNGSKFYSTKSTDGGQTWSTPIPLAGFTFNASYDYRNQSGGYTSAGKYVLVYDKYQDGGAGHSQLKTIYSDDNGVSWSTEVDGVSDPLMDWSITGLNTDVLEFSNGDIGIPFYQSNSTTLKRFFAIAISSDGGNTFSSYKRGLEIDYTSILNWGEPTMIMLDSTTIICVLDSVSDTGRMYQYISSDSGDTWTLQGLLPFDSTTATGSENQFRSRLHEVSIFGKRMIELIYVKREANGSGYAEVKRILANAESLKGSEGYNGWVADTLVVFYEFTLGQRFDGNSSVMHPDGNFRGLYVGEDQTSSGVAQLNFVRTPNDIYDVATKLNINKSNEASNGVLAPDFIPHWLGQTFTDATANKMYAGTGLAASADWTILN